MNITAIITDTMYNTEDILCECTDTTTHMMDADTTQMVEMKWNELLQNAINSGKTCYNGWSYRVESMIERDNKLHIKLSIIEFKKRHILQKMLNNNEYVAPQSYPNGTATAGIVKTNDGYYALVKLSGKSMNSNNYEMPGGLCESVWDNTVITTNMTDELYEEMGILKTDYTHIKLLGVIKTKGTQYIFIYYTPLNISKNELLERYKTVVDTDIAGIECFVEDDYKRVMKRISPVKQLAIELLERYYSL